MVDNSSIRACTDLVRGMLDKKKAKSFFTGLMLGHI